MKLLTKASWSDAVTQREKDNLQIAYRAACEGIVMLKNDGALPFANKKVALYGPGVSMTIKGGTGSGEVNERHSVTILEGMEDRGFEVTTKSWITRFEEHYQKELALYKEEKKKRVNILKMESIMSMLFDNFRFPDGPAVTDEDVTASDTDCCIYVLARQAGEGGDRKVEAGDFLLTEGEKETIQFLAEKYEKFVLAINCGSAMDMNFFSEIPGINAILYICQLGTEGGHAFADIISGEVTPSGKLTSTWAKKYEDVPYAMEYGALNGDLQEEYYKEGIYVGYRYYDRKEMDVLFPFGHGLSYTKFEYSDLWLSASEIDDTETVTATVTVKNVGDRTGKTVVQLYVRDVESTPIRPVRELKGFEKVELRPGETKQVNITLDKRSFAYWNQEIHDWHVETGEFVIEVGQSSRDIALTETVKVNSTVDIPRKYTMDSIVMDILDDPVATEALKPVMEAISQVLTPQTDEPTAASEAITAEMNMAMLQYMPLRGILSFGGGQVELPPAVRGLLGMGAEEE